VRTMMQARLARRSASISRRVASVRLWGSATCIAFRESDGCAPIGTRNSAHGWIAPENESLSIMRRKAGPGQSPGGTPDHKNEAGGTPSIRPPRALGGIEERGLIAPLPHASSVAVMVGLERPLGRHADVCRL